ncbi:ribosome biogenesis GTP-binding protein YihA/YsxC [Desulfovibrio falkowii]|uniref:Probable GTP-binding protein EngB n=1 Tax=Desulfovibrio falkowii TaxID=3136602 RepID=A0ABQ0E7X1_9BACT|nr:ribosome biogenesis GTP-binding protein YihA/YsxC [Desulfovibrio desulfuricans]
MAISLTLESTAYTLDQLTAHPEAQIALAGRSNVGKSSLVNALAGRKKLAKVSSTPGKTRSVNFYLVEPLRFYLVDLPGYGYARASHSEREKWAKLLERYLTECASLKALALLLDCRLPPQQLDLNLASFAQAHGLPLVPILTKADKCNQRERAAKQKEWQNIVGICPVLTSSSSRLGIDRLWQELARAAGVTIIPSAENAQ